MTLRESGSDYVAYLEAMTRRIGGFGLEKERSLLSDPRVMELLIREKAGTIEELVLRLQKNPEGPLHHSVVESLAVSDTSFFRDRRAFDAIEKILLPRLVEKKGASHPFVFWSAGCSTGQEAYSLAIAAHTVLGSQPESPWSVIGTDLSTRSIRYADGGVYSQFDINCGLPARRLVDFFEKRENHWCIQKTIKNRVTFRKVNLVGSEEPFPSADVILLRNVAAYFDPSHRESVLKKVRAALRPDGLLVMGQGESAGREHGFESVQFGQLTCFRPADPLPSSSSDFSI